MLNPLTYAIIAEAGQPPDIAIPRSRKHNADRWHICWCHLSTLQYYMDERTSRSTVAIRKRMNCLKLSVDQRGLYQRGKEVGVNRFAEVFKQCNDLLMRRRHEIGPTRVVVVPTYPILSCPDLARCSSSVQCSCHETVMYGEDFRHRKGLGLSSLVHRQFHGVDV